MSHTIKLWEGYRAAPKKSDKCDPKSVWVHAWQEDHGCDFLNMTIDGEIWVHAWKVNHGGDFLNMTIDREIQGAEEGLAHGLHFSVLCHMPS